MTNGASPAFGALEFALTRQHAGCRPIGIGDVRSISIYQIRFLLSQTSDQCRDRHVPVLATNWKL